MFSIAVMLRIGLLFLISVSVLELYNEFHTFKQMGARNEQSHFWNGNRAVDRHRKLLTSSALPSVVGMIICTNVLLFGPFGWSRSCPLLEVSIGQFPNCWALQCAIVFFGAQHDQFKNTNICTLFSKFYNGADDAVSNRINELCSKDDIVIYQGPTTPLPNGIPTYTVQILNVCVSSSCSISNIHVSCGWFSSARMINPKVFRRVYYDDCVVNNGQVLSPGDSLSFQYANSFQYPLSVSSVNC